MVYAFTLDVPIDEEAYRRIVDEIGPEPMAGALLHLCVRRADGGLRYIDVWESEQAHAAAQAARIGPAVHAVLGHGPAGVDPATLDVVGATGPLLAGAG